VSTGQGRGAPSLQPQLHHTHTASNSIHIHIHIHAASPELRQRPVDLQRRTQVPRASIADVVASKAANVQV
jgi:hypothetical protein